MSGLEIPQQFNQPPRAGGISTARILAKLGQADWSAAEERLHAAGCALLPGILSREDCEALIGDYDRSELYKRVVTMERHRYGLGEYKYFGYPLPGVVQAIREAAYARLAPIANQWVIRLKLGERHPGTLAELHALCRRHDQNEPSVLILKYGQGGFNMMHQDLYGAVFFPIQLVLLLNEPGAEFSGGEFVLTRHEPKGDLKATVLQPRRGDMLLFATRFLPVKGARRFRRASVRHGVSEVQSGTRHTLGIIFHDAAR